MIRGCVATDEVKSETKIRVPERNRTYDLRGSIPDWYSKFLRFHEDKGIKHDHRKLLSTNLPAMIQSLYLFTFWLTILYSNSKINTRIVRPCLIKEGCPVMKSVKREIFLLTGLTKIIFVLN